MFSGRSDLALSTLKEYMGLHHTGKAWNEPQNNCHTALSALGANWLVRVKKCRAVMVERGGCAEMPDAIGFSYQESFIVEAKVTRSDFLADAKKSFRQAPETGIGKYRYYICPKGLISPDELPEKWGLLYVSEKGIIRKIKDAEPFPAYNRDSEFLMLTSALATPWKLFQHWNEKALEKLFRMRWISPNTEVDLKLFACRLAVHKMDEGVLDHD